jgi:Ca2+-binding RTX toxin-like protein
LLTRIRDPVPQIEGYRFMAIRLVTTAVTAPVILDISDTAYVSPSGSIINSTGPAIFGRNTGSVSTVVAIDGTAVSLFDDAIRLPGPAPGTGSASHRITIGEGGLVRSTAGDGIDVTGSLSSLQNDGEIHATGVGVVMVGDAMARTNSGLVSAFGSGLSVGGTNANIQNTGTVVSRSSAISLSGTGASLINTGVLSGATGVSANGTADISNAGDIGGTSTGISVNGRGTVANTGTIQGENAGIFIEVNNFTGRNEVVNAGTITGATGVVFSSTVFGGVVDQQVTNTGTILGRDIGIAVGSSAAAITNHGTIGAAESFAITGQAQVALKNYGTIAGGTELNGLSGAISLGIFADTIRNFGTITGSVLTGDGNDVVRNGGRIDREVNLGAGSDLYQGQRSTEDATVYGGDQRDIILSGGGDDLIFGGSGEDVIRSGEGSDTIHAGSGRDTMAGNGGADLFVFGTADDISNGSKRDVIENFKSGEDQINLGAFMPGGAFIGEAGFTAANQVRYTAATGRIEGDVNGDGTADWALDLSNAPATLTAADFIFT